MSWRLLAVCACLVGCSSATPDKPAPDNPAKTDAPPAAGDRYRYDAAKGVCANSAGTTGLNTCDPAEVVESKDGECCKLAGAEFMGGVRTANFKGADLRGAVFAAYQGPLGADLSGADLRKAYDNYGMHMHGAADAHTKLDARCKREKDAAGKIVKFACPGWKPEGK